VKITLTARLVTIMVLSILLSSLISIFLVSSFTMRKVMGYSDKRDLDLTFTIADALSRSADEGRLESAIESLMIQRNRGFGPMMGMGTGMPFQQGGRRRNDAQGFPPVMADGEPAIPLVITDRDGIILQGQAWDKDGNLLTSIPDSRLDTGAPFFNKGQIAGYVLTGRQAGIVAQDSEMFYFQSIFRGILLYPTLAALLASLLGALLLRKALKPLKSLYQGVLTIGRGEYSYRVEVPGGSPLISRDDELVRLSEGFNEMASSLEASEEWKKQIISDTAHELRTPVSLILGNLEMILDGVYQADRPRLESLYRESTHLAELIRNLQILASEESRQNRTEKELFSLSELVSGCVDNFKALADKEGIRLISEPSEDLHFRGDRNKTHQVLKNLLVNALRHTPQGGSVFSRCYKEKGFLFVEIEDTGSGIPESLRQRVFDRFFKVDPSRNSSGSGLGLSISKAFIENQGGMISAHEGSRGGALFRISFPEEKTPLP